MTLEASIFDALKSLVSNRVYPDVGPDGVVKPYITYQQVGGTPINFLSQQIPNKRNARVQINVWSETRAEAAALSSQSEDALRLVLALQTTVLDMSTAIYEEDTKLFGFRQDFSFWY